MCRVFSRQRECPILITHRRQSRVVRCVGDGVARSQETRRASPPGYGTD